MQEINAFTNSYFLTAGECDAQGRIPLTLMMTRLIETATDDANRLGIGYSRLIEYRLGWVLSRVAIEIDERPAINTAYTVTTWIKSLNRLYSERCFEFCLSDGTVFARATSIWVAIDLEKRTPGDLSFIDAEPLILKTKTSDVKLPARPSALAAVTHERSYTFQYCDLDFYRHVNTVRYVEVVLNQWPLEQYDKNAIGRFEITFNHECHFGDRVEIKSDDSDSAMSMLEIERGTERVTSVRIFWRAK